MATAGKAELPTLTIMFEESGLLVVFDSRTNEFAFIVGGKYAKISSHAAKRLRDAMATEIGYIG